MKSAEEFDAAPSMNVSRTTQFAPDSAIAPPPRFTTHCATTMSAPFNPTALDSSPSNVQFTTVVPSFAPWNEPSCVRSW